MKWNELCRFKLSYPQRNFENKFCTQAALQKEDLLLGEVLENRRTGRCSLPVSARKAASGSFHLQLLASGVEQLLWSSIVLWELGSSQSSGLGLKHEVFQPCANTLATGSEEAQKKVIIRIVYDMETLQMKVLKIYGLSTLQRVKQIREYKNLLNSKTTSKSWIVCILVS